MRRLRGTGRVVLAVVALGCVFSLAVFPARAYLDQHRQRQRLASEAADLAGRNQGLAERVAVLETDAEVERIARSKYNLGRPGEEAYAIRPSPTTPPPPPEPAPETPERGVDRILNAIASLF